MATVPLRLLLAGLALAAAGALGAWLAAGHYRLQLDEAQGLTAQCRLARGSLERVVGEQNVRVAEMRAEAEQRQQVAAQAQAQARQTAAGDYAAAQRLQQERIGGDQCTAAATVIDQELGL